MVPESSGITSVADLKGKSVAATKGTDPYFFLLQSLDEAGISAKDVTVQNLQHADGRAALENGSVDAWSGPGPDHGRRGGSRAPSSSTATSRFNTYGFLNATESFLADQAARQAQAVVNAYEKARAWAAANPDETAADPRRRRRPGPRRREDRGARSAPTSTSTRHRARPSAQVLAKIGPIFVESGDVASQQQIDDAVASLLDDSLVKKADASAIKDS